MRFRETEIPGCYEVRFPAFSDARGTFVKSTHRSAFAAHGLSTDLAEIFYTVSNAGVLRGMHLQLPPAHQAKLVYCVTGQVMDIVLDLRIGSPAYGRFVVVELGASESNGVYLPEGVEHGFYVQDAPATMIYHVTAEHAPHLDAGVRWDSFEAPWPNRSPVLSVRDASLPAFQDFESPFTFETAKAASL